jgi:hypothetical protein
MGEIVDGMDMRAEVALLSRNILIYGEMENTCYGNNWCQFFGHDTYGGHIKVCAYVTIGSVLNLEPACPVHFSLSYMLI